MQKMKEKIPDDKKTNSSEYLTTTEAAAYLNVAKQTLEVWRVKGCGPEYLKMGRAVRYHRTRHLDSFAEKSIRRNTSEA